MSDSSIETAGLGVGKSIDDAISDEILMEVLEIKISNPQEFLPVTDVFVRCSDDGLGTYREMSMGPKRIIENIYIDMEKLEVIFSTVGGTSEHVNAITTDENGVRKLEFFVRDKVTKERVEWDVPWQLPLGGIQKCLDRARCILEEKK